MKTLTILAMTLAFVSAPALAGSNYTSNQIGDFTYTNGPNGYRGTANQIGDFTYYHDNQGNRCTTNQIGNFAHINCN